MYLNPEVVCDCFEILFNFEYSRKYDVNVYSQYTPIIYKALKIISIIRENSNFRPIIWECMTESLYQSGVNIIESFELKLKIL